MYYREGSFKRLHDVEIRSKLCEHADPEVLVIVEQTLYPTKLPLLRQTEFTVPRELPIPALIKKIRVRLNLEQTQLLFLTCNGNLLTATARIASLPKDIEDGIVYLVYTDSIVGEEELLEASGRVLGGSMWWSEPTNASWKAVIQARKRRGRNDHEGDRGFDEAPDTNHGIIIFQAAERRSMLQRKKRRDEYDRR
ncbi:hypothetical protein K440DRAFT_677353 [Wilcoxina mikolae CBS 423.85]|nr:hypothetical protein K440DRAFT_677353 [Wilcoxina mikolae CBS 423.85]